MRSQPGNGPNQWLSSLHHGPFLVFSYTSFLASFLDPTPLPGFNLLILYLLRPQTSPVSRMPSSLDSWSNPQRWVSLGLCPLEYHGHASMVKGMANSATRIHASMPDAPSPTRRNRKGNGSSRCCLVVGPCIVLVQLIAQPTRSPPCSRRPCCRAPCFFFAASLLAPLGDISLHTRWLGVASHDAQGKRGMVP